MADQPEFQAGEGTPDQLPRGEATAVNEANTPQAKAPEAAKAPMEEDTSEPEMAAPADYEPLHQPEGDDEAFITGPTTRPDESVSTGAFARGPRSLSPRLAAAMPMFADAASLPDAPPQLLTLMALLAQDAEQ